MAIELYVPASTPIINTYRNSRMVAPPNSNKARRVTSKVKLVFRDRPIVSEILRFTISSNGLIRIDQYVFSDLVKNDNCVIDAVTNHS